MELTKLKANKYLSTNLEFPSEAVTFKVAVNLITSQFGLAAFAFNPLLEREVIVGGTLFIIHQSASDIIQEWEIDVATGFFGRAETKGRRLLPSDIKLTDFGGELGINPQQLHYRLIPEELAATACWHGILSALGILHGINEEESQRLSVNTDNWNLIPSHWQCWFTEHLPEYDLRY